MNTLVLYFSRTGTTARVANTLGSSLDAQVAQIKCSKYRPGWFRYLLAGYDSVKGRLPPIEVPDVSTASYDLLLLGAPVWTSYPALPLRSFLAQDYKLPPRVGLFLTCGGHSAPSKAVDFVSILLSVPLVASLTLQHDQIVKDKYSKDVTAFVHRLTATQ